MTRIEKLAPGSYLLRNRMIVQVVLGSRLRVEALAVVLGLCPRRVQLALVDWNNLKVTENRDNRFRKRLRRSGLHT